MGSPWHEAHEPSRKTGYGAGEMEIKIDYVAWDRMFFDPHSCRPDFSDAGYLGVVVCGFIEGYISPDPDFPMINRVIIGFGFWIVMLGALSGRLFGRQAKA